MSTAPSVLDAPVGAPAGGDRTPPDRAWWDRLEVSLGLLILVACCVYIVVQLEPRFLLRNTTPAGGDTGAHVWWPAYLRDHLLPFRLAGWSPDYFAGFPAGQFYFPLPALLIVGLNAVVPYNVAFKLVTGLGPVLFPVGGYVLARGLRAPNPTPAALAVAATGFVFFTGDPGASTTSKNVAFNQHIMGGNLASSLAGEFSYTLALALALCFLGALAWSLRTHRSPWLPAVLFAATAMSHLVVAVFAVVGAFVVILASPARDARPVRRTAGLTAGAAIALLVALFVAGASGLVLAAYVVVVAVAAVVRFWPWATVRRALLIGVVGALLTAVWSVPLAATLQYTTDMRYATITEYGRYLFPFSYLWGPQGALPWQWGAAALVTIAVVGGALGRRPSTFVLVTLTALTGLMFRVWASVQATPAWNLRVLPFWYLCVFLLMGLGVAELVRGAAWLAPRVGALARSRTEPVVVGTAPAPAPAPRWGALTLRHAATVTAVALTAVLGVGALVNIDHGKSFLPFWVKWNESGYQDARGESGLKKAYREYRRLINTISHLPPGRVQWEGGQAINNYGTPLALMLLPYWTDNRFPSMEGLYYESSATTPYVFMTAAAIDGPGNASNPVRGVPYRTISDFSVGVRYLQLTGVRYYVAHSSAARQAASIDPRLRLVATSATGQGGVAPDQWSVYEVASSPLVSPLAYQPVVVDQLSSAEQSQCRQHVREQLATSGGSTTDSVILHEWQDCIGVPWFNDPAALDRPLVADGPSNWQHAQPTAARALPKQPLAPVTVTKVHEGLTSISFHVSRVGVPVLVKTSYFPNWQVSGASAIHRSTPNFMVVVPTSHDVRLTYGTTAPEWIGRLLTLVGLLGVAFLVVLGRRAVRGAQLG